MGMVFFVIAAVFFFFAAVSVTIFPNPLAWGLCAIGLGLAIGGWVPPNPFRRTPA